MLKAIAENPYVSLVTGILLLVTASIEIIEDADRIGAHHGIALFALVQILSVIPHLTHSAKELHEGREALSKSREET
ncbi:MAG: hypothetical protein ACPHTD_01395 [Gammaproteobacteria bacterium]|jgi:hypothetical protein